MRAPTPGSFLQPPRRSDTLLRDLVRQLAKFEFPPTSGLGPHLVPIVALARFPFARRGGSIQIAAYLPFRLLVRSAGQVRELREVAFMRVRAAQIDAVPIS